MSETIFRVADLAGLNAAFRVISLEGGGNDGSAGEGTAFTISLDVPSGTLTLDAGLLAINLAEGTSLTLLGNGATLDGAGWQRGLFVQAGTVTIQGLTIANTVAAGGVGGDGWFGGGGGGGLGGGLFVAAAGVVTLQDVAFTNNTAQGGHGGDGNATGAGGGGGMGGNGGDGSGPDWLSYGGDNPTGFGGGGGLGLGADGGSLSSQSAGADGIATGAGSGGRGSDFQPAGAEGGGGGAGRLANFLSMAGGGGVDGHDGGKTDPERSWGTGGFGGGGGGTLGTYGGTVGGFGGGGGGSLLFNGTGGFGGGGGASGLARGDGHSAGYGAGNGGIGPLGGGGGGGLGAGGAIFVQQGGSLAIVGGSITGGSALGGAGGTGLAAGPTSGENGQGLGSGIFLHGGQVITLAGLPGGMLTIDDTIAEGPPAPGTGHAGLIIAAGGTVALGAANSFAGGVLLQDDAILRLGNALAAGTGAIRFAAGATAELVIDGPTGPAGVLEGVTETTAITLRAIAPASATATLLADNCLRVTDGATTLMLRLNPGLDIAGLQIALAASGGGGTTLTLHGMPADGVPCFRHGTAIATPGGEVAVERLRIGDLVLTRHGDTRRVRWIGRREVSPAEMAAMPELRPVLLRRGALAPGVPARDLFLSPLHAIHVGGALIPAAALVNGTSILRASPPGGMQYCHVELDDQALIRAEGVPAETFLDQASRAMFHNAASYAALDIGPAPAPAPLGEPRIEGGYRVEAIRRRLARRAGLPVTPQPPGTPSFHIERHDGAAIEGWALDPVQPGHPMELELRAAGHPLSRGLANHYRADLDRAALADGSCAFRLVLPATHAASGLTLHRARDGLLLAAIAP